MQFSKLLSGFGRIISSGLCVFGFLQAASSAKAAVQLDPNLNVGIWRTNQGFVLNWFASNTVSYQVESSSNLVVWSNASAVVTGSSSTVYVTNTATPGNAFFRVRRLPLLTAAFDVTLGILRIYGDDQDNVITVSRNAGGALLVNNGAVQISGGIPTIANTVLIEIYGRPGGDQLSLNEDNGALPRANIFGEDGDDVLTGGSGADQIFGGPGQDSLAGRGGADMLYGGTGNDTLTGGDADDQVFGEGDNDRLVWNPGDDTDLNEGGIGTDTVEVNGGGGAEQFTTTANGTRVRFDRLDPAPFSLDIGTCEQLVLNANGGDDSFSATGNLAALIQITVDGGTGADTILGSNGIDILMGGDNDDFIDGQQGNDVVFLGGGNDTFQWDPGDGSDVVEGQSGSDTVLFNGSAGNENFVASANGLRVLFTRDLGNIVMDLNDVENFNLRALGGTDTVSVNPMNGTDLITFNVSLALAIGGATGDAVADTVIVNGSSGADLIDVFGAGTSASVVGLFAQVNITTAEGTNDVLIVNALSGDDSVTATTVPAGVIKLTLDGGTHNDMLLGSQDADVLLGGDGDDFLHGDGGNDVAFMGANNDVFRWDPGDGNDTIEGQAGVDTLTFYGSAVAENISVTPNGGRVLFFRDIASVTLDMDDVETVNYRALAGADNVVVGDLSGTDLASISVDLSGPGGGGDLAADTVTVNGSQVADNMAASGNVTGVSITGLHTAVNILSQESVNDRLTLNGLGGDDVVDASALGADGIQLSINGGLGADILLGSQGGDLINGGDGNDLAFMGPGGDAFVWNPGDDLDTIEGQAGVDTLIFNGANVAESINISANGSRVLFFRDIASVTLDLNSVETLDCNVLGGADNVVCNSLAGTDLTTINMNLAASGGAGDAALDLVTINGTASPDVITLTTNSGAVEVSGLATLVRITAPEVANDDLVVNGLGGTDTFTIGPGVTTLIGVSVNQ